MKGQKAYGEKIGDAAMRFVFYGRVSTEDNQDPTLSLPRQLANCEKAVAEAGGIVAHFCDVEVGSDAPRCARLGQGSGRLRHTDTERRRPRRSDRRSLFRSIRRGRMRVDQPALAQPVRDVPRRGAACRGRRAAVGDRRAVRGELRLDRASSCKRRIGARLPSRIEGQVAAGDRDRGQAGTPRGRQSLVRVSVRRDGAPQPAQGGAGSEGQGIGARSGDGAYREDDFQRLRLERPEHHRDPGEAECGLGPLPSAAVARPEAKDRDVGTVERVGDPAQPQVHGLHGVEQTPAKARGQDQPA
jgi:hypothetical protein